MKLSFIFFSISRIRAQEPEYDDEFTTPNWVSTSTFSATTEFSSTTSGASTFASTTFPTTEEMILSSIASSTEIFTVPLTDSPDFSTQEETTVRESTEGWTLPGLAAPLELLSTEKSEEPEESDESLKFGLPPGLNPTSTAVTVPEATTTAKTTTEEETTTISLETNNQNFPPFFTGQENQRSIDILGDYSVQCDNKRLCIYVRKQFLLDNQIREDEFVEFGLQGLQNDENGAICGEYQSVVDPTLDTTGYLQFCSFPNAISGWGCGTSFQQNDTHFIYENNVFFRRSPLFAIGINGTCTTERNMLVSDTMGVYINNPKMITMTIPIFRGGEFPVMMNLYQDMTWSAAYQQPPFLDLGLSPTEISYMFIAIRHIKPLPGASVQVLRLWGTPSADSRDPSFYNIISDQCREKVNGHPVFEVDNFLNGEGSIVRYQVPVFAFPNSGKVYLHADVRICFQDNGLTVCTKTCAPYTFSRKRRSSDELIDDSETITWGPIYINKPDDPTDRLGQATLKVANQEENLSGEVKLIIVVVIGSVSVLILGIILGVLLKRSLARKDFT
ncbi:Oidioi.mRNA.OKI2018_I69.chr1.g1294.t1.cds [Oikopleura dioica]|uniref:Oidioi.mRNA.OKI2018_I69.chr1.g1294.t1.cds n=1 Tax=Oikopleura dioica TaxID=34765 RepID=A0ABN7SN03_OIKDI|nr:Oidioi.mRNA.OKI2018_I69.chr1.g1294.t1.cds [Oikopleura dioica]